MRKTRMATRALGLATAAVGLALATTTSASAVSISQDGLIVGSGLDYYGCKANIHAGIGDDGKGYARAIFDVGSSQHGWACEGWFQRSVNGSTWARIGDVHTGGVSSTAWYFANADDGYAVRVCVGEISTDPNSYTCGWGYSVDPGGAGIATAVVTDR